MYRRAVISTGWSRKPSISCVRSRASARIRRCCSRAARIRLSCCGWRRRRSGRDAFRSLFCMWTPATIFRRCSPSGTGARLRWASGCSCRGRRVDTARHGAASSRPARAATAPVGHAAGSDSDSFDAARRRAPGQEKARTTRAGPADQLAAVSEVSRRRGLESIDLSLLTDGLEAEREQGITIDVAYRYFATAKRKFIIADRPPTRREAGPHG